MPKLHVYAWLPTVLAAGAMLQAAETAPANDPKEAIRSFLTAPDEAGLRGSLLVPPATQEDVEPLIAALVATTKLQRAAESQYGNDAHKYFSDSTKAILDARLKTLENARVQVNGDTAIVDMPADAATRQSAGTVHLQKVNGEWKIEAASMLGVKPGDKVGNERRAAVARTITEVTNKMIADIQANKFASASDAFREYWNRSNEARRAAASQPRPENAPATAPAAAQ